MPATPELGDGRRAVWPIEVLGKGEAEHPREADGHVGVAREVEIDLGGVREDPKPRAGGRDLVVGQGKNAIGDERDLIGDQDFLR